MNNIIHSDKKGITFEMCRHNYFIVSTYVRIDLY